MKPGDNVVCINHILNNIGSDLEQYKTYKIVFVHTLSNGTTEIRVSLRPSVSYSSKRFVSLTQFRKMKMDKLKERILQ